MRLADEPLCLCAIGDQSDVAVRALILAGLKRDFLIHQLMVAFSHTFARRPPHRAVHKDLWHPQIRGEIAV